MHALPFPVWECQRESVYFRYVRYIDVISVIQESEGRLSVQLLHPAATTYERDQSIQTRMIAIPGRIPNRLFVTPRLAKCARAHQLDRRRSTPRDPRAAFAEVWERPRRRFPQVSLPEMCRHH
jgi:hypothetical protein